MTTPLLNQKCPVVLVIDNEPAIVEMLEFLLEDDYNVSTCLNSATAIQQATLIQPDLIIMDVMMPAPNGVQVLKCLRQTPALADVPVILMTANSRLNNCGITESELPALKATFINKPFDNYELLDLMKDLAK
ncbi:MAG: diguanylate cyclase [Chloroflexi bacterium]|nr:diguanylate cyclase [Chloroflexota bacterium]